MGVAKNAMSATKLLTIAVAVTLLIGGAATVTAMGPADDVELPGEANATAENASMSAENATDDPDGLAAEANESVGPPGGLPDVVPDFVRDIHGTIDEFRAGTIDSLGSALRQVIPFG